MHGFNSFYSFNFAIRSRIQYQQKIRYKSKFEHFKLVLVILNASRFGKSLFFIGKSAKRFELIFNAQNTIIQIVSEQISSFFTEIFLPRIYRPGPRFIVTVMNIGI